MLRNDIQFLSAPSISASPTRRARIGRATIATAGEDGLNIFRHWFMWCAIEVARRASTSWEEYDRQLDLAAKNGIKTVIAELIHAVPDWAVPQMCRCAAGQCGRHGSAPDGRVAATGGFSNNGGGAGALTLNCPEVKEAAGKFLTALATRYKDHPALYGYDVWNEVQLFRRCRLLQLMPRPPSANGWRASTARLKAAGQGLAPLQLCRMGRYRAAGAHGAPIPRASTGSQFKRDNFTARCGGAIDTIRAIDQNNVIAAHGISGAIPSMAANGCDDWLAASEVELYGLTWVQARAAPSRGRTSIGADVTRAAARGKPCWHAERPGGPLWLQPQVLGRDKEDGRVAEPEDIRICTHDLVRRRRSRRARSALAPAARRAALRRLRLPMAWTASARRVPTCRAPWPNGPTTRRRRPSWDAKARSRRGRHPRWSRKHGNGTTCSNYDHKEEKPYPEAMWGAYRAFLGQGLAAGLGA